MEAFAAVGLASNVVQFIETLFKIIRSTREIHDSACGGTEHHIALEIVFDDLRAVSRRLKTYSERSSRSSTNAGPHLAPVARNPGVEDLAVRCEKIADALVNTLIDFRVQNGMGSFRKCCGKALKAVWKKSYIEELSARATMIRQELSFHLQVENTTQLDILREGCDILRKDSQTHTEALVRFEHTLAKHEKQSSALATKEDISDFFMDVSQLVDAESGRKNRVLRSLHFPSIHERHSDVAQAHAQTFQWIFSPHLFPSDDPRSRIAFTRWLGTHAGVYWITGKPGSGKSTLMKYLCNNPKMLSLLAPWAYGSTLTVSKFFYWHGGSKMQKSLQGLLQSLLFEIFRQRPDWIKTICPSRWSSDAADLEPWTIPEMVSLLRRFAKQDFGSHKFCFFIDGLDEHEGNLDDLIDCLRDLDCSPNIKLCISSRPWNCFEDAYGVSEMKLRLEDLTKSDMEKYISDGLVPALQKSHIPYHIQFAHAVTSEILAKAQGVFLWVILAVQSLRRGITEGDTVELLRQRMQSFPPELYDFFNLILGSIEPIYRRDTATLLLAALTAPQPLSTIAYSFFMDADSELPKRLEWQPLEQIHKRHELVRRRVNARCKGLLEVYDQEQPKVDFLHRTVREFLMGRDIEIFRYIPKDKRVDKPLCQAVLGDLKTCSAFHKARHFECIWELLAYTEANHGDPDIELIDALDNHCIDYLMTFDEQEAHQTGPSRILLDMVLKHRIFSWLKSKLASSSIDKSLLTIPVLARCARRDRLEIFRLMLKSGIDVSGTFGSKQLWAATAPAQRRQVFAAILSQGADVNRRSQCGRLIWMQRILDQIRAQNGDSIQLDCAELFLSHAADPNSYFNTVSGKCTAWQRLLQELSTISEPADHHFQIVDLFLRHGADPLVSVATDSGVVEVGEVFRKVFSTQLASILQVRLEDEVKFWKSRDTDKKRHPLFQRKRKIDEIEWNPHRKRAILRRNLS